jgi:hypothetical protein
MLKIGEKKHFSADHRLRQEKNIQRTHQNIFHSFRFFWPKNKKTFFRPLRKCLVAPTNGLLAQKRRGPKKESKTRNHLLSKRMSSMSYVSPSLVAAEVPQCKPLNIDFVL